MGNRMSENVSVYYTHYEVLEALAELAKTDITELVDEIMENYLEGYVELFGTTKEKLLEEYRKKHE